MLVNTSPYIQIIPIERRVSEAKAFYGRRATFTRATGQLGFEFSGAAKNGGGLRDPAFSENKTQPLHRWVPWIAGFSAQFVQDCFETFLKYPRKQRKPCILDPFAGVGTTPVQAMLNGFDYVGFEINPYAALACEVKLKSGLLDPSALEAYRCEYATATLNIGNKNGVRKPEEFRTRIPFFSPSVEKQVFAFLDFIDHIPHPSIADVFRTAFGSVMVSFSNYSYEPSLSSRPGAGKPLVEHAQVSDAILTKLDDMIADIRWAREKLSGGLSPGKGRIYKANFLGSDNSLASASVDLVVTSPPYMNNYHYVRNTRPQLFWLSLVSSPKDLKVLEQGNFGKYWQTVRESAPVGLVFQHAELEKALCKLRATRSEAGAYGGPGWANYVASYFNDCYRFVRILKRVLARGAIAVVVIGNSIIQGHELKTDLILADIAKDAGLEVLGVQQVRTKRVGNSITQSAVRRGNNVTATLYDSAVIARKR